MGGFKNKRAFRRYQDIERDLPPRLRKAPKPGDGPLKRPYPSHARDIEILDALLEDVPREMPSEFIKRDLRTATRPQGVLYFHVLDIQDIQLSKKDFIPGASLCVYVEYECQGAIKCSYPVHTFQVPKIRIDHHAHFSADVSEVRSDEANDFVIHVYGFQNPEKHWLIGSQLLHLYNFVRDIHGISSVDIQDDLSYYSGSVTFEFAWAYGAYGYGHSNQLRNTKNPVYDSVCHSMFPRIAPSPDDLIDNKFRVRVPKRLRLITLYSLMLQVPVMDKDERLQKAEKKKNAESEKKQKKKITRRQLEKLPEERPKPPPPDFNREAKTLIFRRVRYARGRPVHAALNLDIHQKFMENDFNQTYGEYICLRNRRERLECLTRMVEGRLRDRLETEFATGLFYPVENANEARAALSEPRPLACPPGFLENKAHPCRPQREPQALDPSDQKFIEGLPSAPRFSGYLAQVFGYAPTPDTEAKPVEKHEFQVKSNAFLGGGDDEVSIMTYWERKKYNWRMFWYNLIINFKNFWDYIFPSAAAKLEEQLPEVSVTLPSPADSTTEFYAHCVQEKVYQTTSPLIEARRQAVDLVRASRRKDINEEEPQSDSEEYEKWDIQDEYEDIMKVQRKTSAVMNFEGRDIRKSRDIRPLEHVGKASFGTQHERPKFHQAPW